MHAFAKWLEATALSQGIQDRIWLIELLQTIHILSVAMVFSAVVMVGLRITGARHTYDQTLPETVRRFMPWFWTAVAVLAATGTVLIIGEPRRALDDNLPFLAKMIMVALAVAAALAFEMSLQRRPAFWDDGSRRQALRRCLAVAGIVLVCAIIVAGRWIAYSGPDD